MLGEMYYLGRGVERDYRQAEVWLSRAAKQNVPGAEELLQRDGAFRLRRKKLMLKHVNLAAGLGSPGDLEFLRRAAEEDMGEAQQLLGQLYLCGNGVPRDCRKAAMWLSRAAKRNSSDQNANRKRANKKRRRRSKRIRQGQRPIPLPPGSTGSSDD